MLQTTTNREYLMISLCKQKITIKIHTHSHNFIPKKEKEKKRRKKNTFTALNKQQLLYTYSITHSLTRSLNAMEIKLKNYFVFFFYLVLCSVLLCTKTKEADLCGLLKVKARNKMPREEYLIHKQGN